MMKMNSISTYLLLPSLLVEDHLLKGYQETFGQSLLHTNFSQGLIKCYYFQMSFHIVKFGKKRVQGY